MARNCRCLEGREQTLAIGERRIRRNRLQLRVAAGVFLHQLLATLVLVYRTQFRHDLSSLSFLKEPAWSRRIRRLPFPALRSGRGSRTRSEEHTSELKSLMRNSYDVFCLQKKRKRKRQHTHHQ